MEEQRTYLIFSGYHAVSASSDILNRYHINNRIVRAPVHLGRQGCSFAVLIDECDKEMAEVLIRSKGIKIL